MILLELTFLARPIIGGTTSQELNLTQTKEAGNLLIDCIVSGYPKANVTWTKDNRELPNERFIVQDNSSLLVMKASLEDSGTYACVAKNEFGTDRREFTVTVFGMYVTAFLQTDLF